MDAILVSEEINSHIKDESEAFFFHIMTWRLFGARSLSEPLLAYCQMDAREQISMQFNQNNVIFINLKLSSVTRQSLFLGLNAVIYVCKRVKVAYTHQPAHIAGVQYERFNPGAIARIASHSKSYVTEIGVVSGVRDRKTHTMWRYES